jgi:hypothetical protein
MERRTFSLPRYSGFRERQDGRGFGSSGFRERQERRRFCYLGLRERDERSDHLLCEFGFRKSNGRRALKCSLLRYPMPEFFLVTFYKRILNWAKISSQMERAFVYAPSPSILAGFFRRNVARWRFRSRRPATSYRD